MPFYDKRCESCQKVEMDVLEAVSTIDHVCTCGGQMKRVWIGGRVSAVIGDDIPGGMEVRHGLCNEDGSPRKYYSKSEMKREATQRGWVNHVEHIGAPGSDKSKHTSRWV